MSVQSEIRKLFKELKRRGWTISTGGKHYKVRHPLGGFISVSVSPSDHHAYNNILKDIKHLEKENSDKKEAYLAA